MPLIVPDQAALEIAHRRLQIKLPFLDAMQIPVFQKLITAWARKHMKQRMKFDPKKYQCNDND